MKKLERDLIKEQLKKELKEEILAELRAELEDEKKAEEPKAEEERKEGEKHPSFFRQCKEKVLSGKPVPLLYFVWIFLFVVMTISELVFQLVSFHGLTAAFLRMLCFNAAVSGLFGLLLNQLPSKVCKGILIFLSVLVPTYALFQLGIHNMMGAYGMIKTGGDMAGALSEYVGAYFKSVPAAYWLIALIPLCAVFLIVKVPLEKMQEKKVVLIALACTLFFEGIGAGSVAASGLWEQYSYPVYAEKDMQEFGVCRFMLRDLSTLFRERETTLQAVEEEEFETEQPRVIDDTAWQKMSDAEEDKDIKRIDEFFLERTPDGYNEATGLLEGKNLIYIMVEAFDYLALDKELTPTLWKMKNEGWDFTNHYTPKYGSGTGDSELISEVSLIPRSDVTAYNEYKDNTWTNSIFALFNNMGYSTHAYHDWKDEFYMRRDMYASQGAGSYENYEDMQYSIFSGWPSDEEMFELTADEYLSDEKFMTMYVTVTTHFPYDIDTELGNRYLPEINALHPDYPMDVKRYLSKAMDLDKGLEYLLKRLEETGSAEDTAIVMFADHHPLNMDVQYLIDYTTEIDRSENLNEFRSPCFIYSPDLLGRKKLDQVHSTFDLLPTIANLYNLDYDPRLYLGADYFSDKEKIVFFMNGDWVTDCGVYDASERTFIPFTDEELPERYVTNTTNKLYNDTSLSYMIYRADYFAHRPGITTPPSSKKEETDQNESTTE